MNHPEIENAIRTGYPHGDPIYPHCPECGCECDEIYFNECGDIVGCDECISSKSAWHVDECF